MENIIDFTVKKDDKVIKITREYVLECKIRELQAVKENLENEKERLELRVKVAEREFPELLNSQELADFLGIKKKRAQELMRSTGFPMIKVGGNKAIKAKIVDWLIENEGTDPVDGKYD